VPWCGFVPWRSRSPSHSPASAGAAQAVRNPMTRIAACQGDRDPCSPVAGIPAPDRRLGSDSPRKLRSQPPPGRPRSPESEWYRIFCPATVFPGAARTAHAKVMAADLVPIQRQQCHNHDVRTGRRDLENGYKLSKSGRWAEEIGESGRGKGITSGAGATRRGFGGASAARASWTSSPNEANDAGSARRAYRVAVAERPGVT
jgi:hypothetical protein